MKPPRSADNELILGLVSVSDRASQGIYEDKGIPALEAWCRKAVKTPVKIHKRLIADERFDIEKTLRELVDIVGCDLILTTGGTGPARRDVTPEATSRLPPAKCLALANKCAPFPVTLFRRQFFRAKSASFAKHPIMQP